MYDEDDLLPISALQHLIFCPRQCALIHVERIWAENQLTVEGKQLHERSDSETSETRKGLRIVRSLPLRNLKLGIIGKADVVEFHQSAAGDVKIVPVEYKRGKPKKDDSDRVQLCAQAICLEEMCGTEVTEGALFYGTRKRRTPVSFDTRLRQRTTEVIAQLREMISNHETPAAIYSPKCKKCSLIDWCMPTVSTPARSASRFMSRQLAAHVDSDGPSSDDCDSE